MAREATCLFIGIYTVVLIVGLKRLSEGQAAYEGFLAALDSPLSILFHLLALGFTVFHTASWFNVAPKAMPPIQLGEQVLPGGVIIAAQYAAWVIVSLAVLFIAGA
jgi:fumarate reductase subunit C